MTPTTSLVREKPVRPQTTPAPAAQPRPQIVTRAESVPCTCPDACERDHEHD